MSMHRSKQEYETRSNGNYEYITFSSPKGDSKINLEDYIYELKQRNEEMSHDIDRHDLSEIEANLHSSSYNGSSNESSQQHNGSTGDTKLLLSQLAKKEKDLILAAELGKALLDRNEELTKINEKINEEYTRNLELLEQEKYALRKKLNSIEIEYENKIHELQTDLNSVRDKLKLHFEINKQNEAENSRIIDELTEQNQRLTTQLKKSTNRESLLEKEIQSLKEQFQARRTNFSDHIGQLEGLRDEINLLSKRKLELESKISSLNEEKDSISLSLDESQFKILTLEKQLHDNEVHIQSQQRDIDELRRLNTQYQNRLDSYSKSRTLESYKMHGSSLYNEIEMSSHSSGDEAHLQASPNYFEEDIELYTPEQMCDQCAKLKQVMNDACSKLKRIAEDLYKRRMIDSSVSQLNISSNSNNSHDSGIQANLSCVDDLNLIICDIHELTKNSELTHWQCVTCQDFSTERVELDRIRKENQSYRDQFQKLNSQVLQLSSNLTLQESELNCLKDENMVLKQDIASINSQNSQDEIVKRAWKVRDDTISRKKAVEIELAKVRIELMHVNSQLLETIQQKVELSQQLEQWQVDMEVLIEEQLKSKLILQEKNREKVENESLHKKENIFDRIRLLNPLK